MIKTHLSKTDVCQALSGDFIPDKQPLIDYAGFEPGSEYEKLSRQTFSLLLTSDEINNIRKSIEQLYSQLIDACWTNGSSIPFDMVRFDAFLDTEDSKIKIIELNTRNVGLHEIVEWLDNPTFLFQNQ